MTARHTLWRESPAQCLKGDTLVFNATSGWPLTLEDLVGRRDGVVCTMREAGIIAPARPQAYVCAPPTQLYQLTTYTGRTIQSTADLSFLTQDGVWKTLETLGLSDAVAVVAAYPEMFGRGDSDAELIKLLAYLSARDAMDEVAPPFEDEDVRRDFEAAVDGKGDRCEARMADDGMTQLHIYGAFGQGSKVLRYLELVGVAGCTALDRFVPQFVYGLRREKLRLYLNRLFTCDGQIETSGRIAFHTRSLRMAQQVQHLLARFGVVCLLRGIESRGELEAVDLLINTKADVLRYIDEIGFLGSKAARAEEVRAALYGTRMLDASPGRLGRLLFDRVIAVEPTTTEPGYGLALDTYNFVAGDFVVRNHASSFAGMNHRPASSTTTPALASAAAL